MRSKASPITARLVVFYLLSVVGRSTAAIEEAPTSLHASRLSPLLNGLEYEEPSEKKAYAYLPEYKRLPAYNFGLGKRWTDNSGDKRTRPFSFFKRPRDYRFGLGKRDNGYHPLGLDYLAADSAEGYRSREDGYLPDGPLEDKRSDKQQFGGFGLGKRLWKLTTGESGRGANDGPKYLLSLGREMREDDDPPQ